MGKFSGVADRDAVEREMPYDKRDLPVTLYQFLTRTRDAHGARNAITFQLFSDPGAKAITWTWGAFHQEITRAANLFRSLGVGEGDTIAYLLPNCLETASVLLGGAVAGIVNPINPLLDPEQIAAAVRRGEGTPMREITHFLREQGVV